MTKEAEIARHLKALGKPMESVFVGTVKAVDKDTDTITVVDSMSPLIDYDDVRLKGIVAEGDDVVLYPKLGSTVLLGTLRENEYFVASFTEVESIKGTIESLDFHIDKNGYELNRNGKNLLKVLDQGLKNQNSLNKELQKVVVSIGVTPNVPVLQSIEQNTLGVINDLNEILK